MWNSSANIQRFKNVLNAFKKRLQGPHAVIESTFQVSLASEPDGAIIQNAAGQLSWSFRTGALQRARTYGSGFDLER